MDGDSSGAQGTCLALHSSLVLLLRRGLLLLSIPLGPTSGTDGYWGAGAPGLSAPEVPGEARAGSGAGVIITGTPRIHCKSNPEHHEKAKIDIKQVVNVRWWGSLPSSCNFCEEVKTNTVKPGMSVFAAVTVPPKGGLL